MITAVFKLYNIVVGTNSLVESTPTYGIAQLWNRCLKFVSRLKKGASTLKREYGHWHAIIASSCRWSQREYKRQPVHRINHVFAEEPSRRPGRPAVVQQLWRRDVTSPFPPSGNEGYIRNRDVPFQSVTPSHVGWPTNWEPYQSATGAAPSSALCRPPDPSYKADDRTGLHREGRLLLSLEQPKQ